MTIQRPARVARQMIEMAARTLPAAHRERYRREFTAELHFTPQADQVRYAAQVLSRTWSLRAALNEPAPAMIGESTMRTAPPPPLTCRLHIWHKWRTHFAEDGGRYQACAKCGKELPTIFGKNGYFPWSG